MPRAPIPILLAALLSVVMAGCAARSASPRDARHDFTRIIMGVEARITVYSRDPGPARVAARRAFARIAELDAVLSDWREDSELAALGRRAGEGPVPVSADLAAVLARAATITRESGGAFDVTAGPLVALWREARDRGRWPDPAALAAARTRVGPNLLRVDTATSSVTLAVPGMRLDLGGIGKGFAAGEAVATLRASGHPRCLVDLGGDVVAGAPPPGRDAWRIAIDPGLGSGPGGTIPLRRAAVATSGDAEQHAVIEGRRVSHLLDPRTAAPLSVPVAVTVIAPDGATADALASAVSVLGPGEGLALVARFPGAAARVRRLEDGVVRERSSPGFPEIRP